MKMNRYIPLFCDVTLKESIESQTEAKKRGETPRRGGEDY